MLHTIKDYIINLTNSSTEITIEETNIFDNKKLSVVMAKENYMASCEILPNYEYDFLAIDTSNEEIIINISMIFDNAEDLFLVIKENIFSFSSL
jgi:hypothetical protein